MSSLTELASVYHTYDTARITLDRQITASNDIAGKDMLMDEIASVLEKLDSTEHDLAAMLATDIQDLRAKAEVVVAIAAHRDEPSALALSLAEDVLTIAS
jgi:hypothetical protein